MGFGRVLLLSVFLITIVLSINIVDARRSPAAKKKTATLTPESFLDSDQDFGIEVRSDYNGLGGPLAASIGPQLGTAATAVTDEINDLINEVNNAASPLDKKFVETINGLLKIIPKESIGKIDGLELTYDKTIGKFYVINTQGKTDDQIKETMNHLLNVLLSIL